MSEARLLLTRLFLENIKSYEQADIALPGGTIAICGSNGAGKSTLIEAIGFALFGSQRVRQEQLLREGAANGRIEISFASGLDGLSYTVTRELRRSGASTARLYSDAHGFNVAGGVRDVQSEMAQHLGIGDGVSADTLFEGVIGVPQGQLTGDFLLTPTQRRARFEELLALQEFNTAYQHLSGPLGYGRTRIAHADGRLAALDDRIEADKLVRGELVQLQARLGEVERQAAALRSRHSQLVAERERMDQAESRLVEARRALSDTDVALRLAEQRAQEAERRLQEATAAAVEAEASREGHEQYLVLEAAARELEAARAERDGLRRALAGVDTEMGRLESAAASLEDRIAVAAAARQTAEQLRPDVERQAAYEEALAEARARVALFDELQGQLEARSKAVAGLTGKIDSLASGAADIGAAQAGVEQAAAELDAARAEASELNAQLELEKGEVESRRRAEEAVRRGETSACPVCRRPFVEGDAEGFLEHLREEMAAHRHRVEDLRRRGSVVARLLADRKQASEEAEQRLRRARDNASTLQSLRRQYEEAETEARAVESRLAGLEGVQTEAGALQAQLDALENPRARRFAAEAVAAQHDELTAALAAAQQRFQEAASRRAALDSQLDRFADLDQELGETAAARDECRAAFDTHRRFAPLAEEQPARAGDLEKRRAACIRLQSARDDAQRELDEAEAAYDGERHAEVRRLEHQLEVEMARVGADLEDTGRRLGEAAERLARLETLEEERRSLLRSSARDRRAHELLAFLRETVRRAGPEIARLVLARVSQAATVTYNELMSDHAGMLVWGNDYGVTVERAGQSRDFVQLSGGEQVAAALSVRLALLREASDLRIAFFDEPTINLDEARRLSLAEQMRSIRDLDQLFIISHDDSLESVTDNVIRVTKRDGASVLDSLNA